MDPDAWEQLLRSGDPLAVRSALADAPPWPVVAAIRAAADLELGDVPAARAVLEALPDDGSDGALILRLRGDARAAAGDLAGARAAYDAADGDPRRAVDLARSRALLALLAGRPADAATLARAAGDDALLAEALREGGDLAGARAVAADDPAQLLADGDAAGALRLARAQIDGMSHSLRRRRAGLWEVAAEAHRALGEADSALVSLRRAIDLLAAAGVPTDEPRARAVTHLLADGRFRDAARVAAEGLAAAHAPALFHALLLPSAVDARDWAGFTHHLRRAEALGAAPARAHRFAAFAARLAGSACAALAEGGSGPIARAVRAHGLALALFRSLGRPDEAERERRALAALAPRDGARGPVPAGAYDLLRPIGRGATGSVWRARHHERRFAVAVKVLAAEQTDDPRYRRLVADELRALAGLDHPNIVRVLGTGELGPEAPVLVDSLREGSPWLALELAESGTLEPWCGRLPWAQVRAVLLALLDALAHAHARGVVHLDLKPANVLLRVHATGTATIPPDAPRSVLLTDFALAGLVARASHVRVLGTPEFMAPEQFRGDRAAFGPWTDLYALGVLAWTLVRGRLPFHGDLAELRLAHCERPLPLLGAPALDGWLARLAAKAPGERFSRAAAAAAALLALPDDLAVGGTEAIEILWSPAALPPLDADGSLADWRPARTSADVDLAEAALDLLPLRRPPFAGREAERDRLWGALREAVASGATRVAWVTGPEGIGKSALCRWLGERAHELGLPPEIVVWADGDGPFAHPGPRLVLVDGLPPRPDVDGFELPLAPLEDEVVGELLDTLIPLAPAVRAQVIALAGGNPGLLRAIVAELAEADALVRDGVRWSLRAGEAVVLPSAVVQRYDPLVREALAALDPAERGALGAAVLVGRRALPRHWARICAAAELSAPVEEKLAGVLRVEPEVAFVHPAVVDLLAAQGVGDRAAAEIALAALHEPEADVAAALLIRAGRPSEALAPLLAAAEGAADGDRVTALLDERAQILAAADQGDPHAARAALLRARAAHDAGRPYHDAALAALALADADPRAAGEAHLLLARAGHDRGDARAAEHLDAALRAFTGAADIGGIARACLLQADAARAAGQLDRAADGYLRARAASGDDPVLLAAVQEGVARVALARGRVPEAESELAQALRAGGAATASLRVAQADVARIAGQLGVAEARYREAARELPRHDVLHARRVSLGRIAVQVAAGRAGEAAGQLDLLLASLTAPTGSFAATCLLAKLALAARRDDRTWSHALEDAVRALAGLRDIDAPWLLELTGRRALEGKRPERAQVVWKLAAAGYRELGRHADVARLDRATRALG